MDIGEIRDIPTVNFLNNQYSRSMQRGDYSGNPQCFERFTVSEVIS